jgi:hypothetical protein
VLWPTELDLPAYEPICQCCANEWTVISDQLRRGPCAQWSPFLSSRTLNRFGTSFTTSTRGHPLSPICNAQLSNTILRMWTSRHKLGDPPWVALIEVSIKTVMCSNFPLRSFRVDLVSSSHRLHWRLFWMWQTCPAPLFLPFSISRSNKLPYPHSPSMSISDCQTKDETCAGVFSGVLVLVVLARLGNDRWAIRARGWTRIRMLRVLFCRICSVGCMIG